MAYFLAGSPTNQERDFPMLLLLLLLLAPNASQAGNYSQMKSIYDTLLASSNYNPEQRPLLNQSDILYVEVQFGPVSIVEINDVFQSFRCNGFIGLSWIDEILQWKSSDYGGETMIAPKMKDVFRPRMLMMNTMEERDLFEDDYAPFNVYNSGEVGWAPGSIFPAACKLDLTKYPYDEQHCDIELVCMDYAAHELQYVSEDGRVGERFLTKNGQWDILNMSVSTPIKDIGDELKSTILISFSVRRKPTFLIISMILPIVFLSLLNLMVFVIPVESGEKISYGITVLLALSVFLSIMSSLLPPTSDSMPLIISYIFILMVISVLTVVDSVLIVRLHHMEEAEEKSEKAKANFRAGVSKINLFNKMVAPLQTSHNYSENAKNQKAPGLKSVNAEEGDSSEKTLRPIFPSSSEAPKVNKYRLIGKHIDMVSLLVFAVLWVSVTIGFMAAIAA